MVRGAERPGLEYRQQKTSDVTGSTVEGDFPVRGMEKRAAPETRAAALRAWPMVNAKPNAPSGVAFQLGHGVTNVMEGPILNQAADALDVGIAREVAVTREADRASNGGSLRPWRLAGRRQRTICVCCARLERSAKGGQFRT